MCITDRVERTIGMVVLATAARRLKGLNQGGRTLYCYLNEHSVAFLFLIFPGISESCGSVLRVITDLGLVFMLHLHVYV